MLKKITLLSILLALTGCFNMHFKSGFARPWELTMEPPPGPPIYQQAFNDGCSSGYGGYSTSFNKMFWDWKQDSKLTENKVYYQMWKDAYAYCALLGMMSNEHGLGNFR